MEQIDALVVGGGVVGLASAIALAGQGRSVCLLERDTRLGHGTSTRNSGVIHAGLYYPAGSLKATLCVEGRDRLYAFCEQHKVPYGRCGKFVVATSEAELPELERLQGRAAGNGVACDIVHPPFIRQREPHASSAIAALWSPLTGIVQSEALVKTLARLCRERDVAILVGSPLVDAQPGRDAVALTTPHETIEAGTVVNAAGLYADLTSRLLDGLPFTIRPCRGEYAELAAGKREWINGLIYPLPHGVGLGVHFVKTTWGSVLLGPTTCYQESRDDYEGHRLPVEDFLEPARKLVPELTIGDLQPGGTGIRAKLHGPDQAFADFIVQRDPHNTRLIQAAGIDSPGLTSSLAIGARVADIWAS
jgi:L-2-hydroxyglutarate oxidase LhgO